MIGHALSRLGCVLIGHVYPVYKTFKAFKLSDEPSELDEKQLRSLRRILSFWAVMGVFTFAEFFLDVLLSWIPFFYETKIIFLLWLVHSNFSGAAFVYENFIDEVFQKHEVDIDHSLALCKAQVKHRASGIAGLLANSFANCIAMALSKSQDIMIDRLTGEHSVGKTAKNRKADIKYRFEELNDEESLPEMEQEAHLSTPDRYHRHRSDHIAEEGGRDRYDEGSNRQANRRSLRYKSAASEAD